LITLAEHAEAALEAAAAAGLYAPPVGNSPAVPAIKILSVRYL
jgi:hypothetical protein